MKDKRKKCIHCEDGNLIKHGFQVYFKDGVEIRTQQYECMTCHRKSVKWKGMPKKVR